MPQELLLTGMVTFVMAYGYLMQADPGSQYNIQTAVLLSFGAAVLLHIVLDRTVFCNNAVRYKQQMPD